MKRSPLTRKTPLRRTKFKRSKPRPNPAGSDPAHLRWIREQPCCMCGSTKWVRAHHSTVDKGMSRKTPDREAMPLCDGCHKDFHEAKGSFRGWPKELRHQWQRSMSALYAPEEHTI